MTCQSTRINNSRRRLRRKLLPGHFHVRRLKMYQSHPHLAEPDDEARLWRYMDFTKFLALLESRSLHMAALTSFDDPFEGHPPRSVIDAFTSLPPNLTAEQFAERRKVVANNVQMFANTRRYVSASCWHANPSESVAMWAQYLRTGEGLAIQTTFGRLKQAIAESAIPAMGALVRYVDFDTYEPQDVNILVWAALKRTSFEHEREFRLLSLHNPSPAGFALSVNLDVLIEAVYVAPTTPNWVLDLVRSVLARYTLPVDPRRSTLQEAPNYYVLPEWAKGT